MVEGNTKRDHTHMVPSIPPKYGVANTIRFLQGRSTVRLHLELMKQRRMTGLHFWSVGYCVSTVGMNEETIR